VQIPANPPNPRSDQPLPPTRRPITARSTDVVPESFGDVALPHESNAGKFAGAIGKSFAVPLQKMVVRNCAANRFQLGAGIFGLFHGATADLDMGFAPEVV
ncbi:hypothetical protein, partial [Nonomuraea cavernae]|uniref:hypothetical protein n=1 Tax=Nonomuraea cavernae TaxID=2045107 RepID=UPI0033D3AE50